VVFFAELSNTTTSLGVGPYALQARQAITAIFSGAPLFAAVRHAGRGIHTDFLAVEFTARAIRSTVPNADARPPRLNRIRAPGV